jgi:hypothetical protein
MDFLNFSEWEILMDEISKQKEQLKRESQLMKIMKDIILFLIVLIILLLHSLQKI